MEKRIYKFAFTSLLITGMLMVCVQGIHAQFSQLYGNSSNNFFNRLIPDGQDFYVLGRDDGKATVSRINSAGVLSWTRVLDMPSRLTDGMVVAGSGNMIVVGATVPVDSSNHSILGEITRQGVFTCLKTLDVPGAEALTRMDRNANGTFSVVGTQTLPGFTQDVFVLNVSPGCLINSKKVISSPGIDNFANDIKVLCNGNFLVAGDQDGRAVMFEFLPTGQYVTGSQNPFNYNYNDIANTSNCDILAVANSLVSAPPIIQRFDANWLPLWEASLVGLQTLNKVVEDSNGNILLTGRAIIGGITRTVIIKIDDSTGSPIFSWGGARYIENNESSFVGGSIALPVSGGIAIVDGREGNPNGFGMPDAFMAFTDDDLTSECTNDLTLDVVMQSTLFEGPIVEIFNYDVPPETMVTYSSMDWEQRDACNSDTCHADFSFEIDCGVVSFIDQSVIPNTPSWDWSFPGELPSNSTAQNPIVTYSDCGVYEVCLTVNGTNQLSSCEVTTCKNVTIADNTPPIVTCPGNVVVTAIGTSPCSKVVNGLEWVSATDACGVSSIQYGVTGATSAAGFEDASGIMFNEGVSTVTYIARDDCGNTGTCSFTVTVNCASSPMNEGCAKMVATCYSPQPNQPVAVIYDPSFNSSSAPIGNDWLNVPTVYPASWTRAGIGNVFGIALDHQGGDIYLSATDIYNYDAQLSLNIPLVTAAGPGGSAGVYKTNVQVPNTTSTIVHTSSLSGLTAYNAGNSLPNIGGFGNGIGNIVYDPVHQQLFLTNLEDGIIYRINPSGNLLSAFDPFTLDTRNNGLQEKPEERIWGIGIYNGRIYFAREASSTNTKQIWSVGLGASGDFAGSTPVPGFPGLRRGSEVLEIGSVPGAEDKITDIEFASDGRMLLAERGYAHSASVFEYEFNAGAWVSTGVPYNVGYGSGKNSAGGIDYGYVEKNGVPTAVCDGMVWASGNCLNTAVIPGLCDVYGVEGISSSGNAPDPSNGATDLFIDFNHTYGIDQKYQVGDVDLFKCGCPPHSSVCDSVSVTSAASPELLDSCCFILTLHNQEPNYFTGIQLCSSNGVSISAVASLNGWSLNGYSAQFLSLVPAGPSGSLAPGGNYDFIKFCLSNYLNVPNQQLMVKYFGPDETIVCVDTLNFNCSRKPKCIKVTDTVECAGNGKYKMSFCIMSNALMGWNVNSIQLNAPGITFTPSVFSVSNMMPGQMLCGFMTTISGAVDGQTICYSVTAHKDDIATNPNINPTTCCTDTLTLGCVTMPDCICNNLSATATEVDQMGDTCCWKVSLTNGYSNTFFTGVQLDIITGGVVFGAIVNPLGSGWSSTSTPTQAIFKPKPAGAFIGATAMLPTFCLSGITSSSQVPQYIVLSWLGPNGRVICRDTIDLDCEPVVYIPCAALVKPDIHCDPNAPGTYIFTFQVKNNSATSSSSGFNANQIVLNSVTPTSISPTQFNIPSLAPGATSAVQTATIVGVQPNQSVCFNLSIHQSSNGSELNCCTNSRQYCFTMPSCPCDTAISAGGLTGYFPFVTNAQDLSPTGIPGFVNGPTSVTGHDNSNNSAYRFNGISDGIDITTDNRNISNEVTIVAWVKTIETQFGQWVAGKYAFLEDKGYGLSIGTNVNTNIGFVAFGGRDGTSTYHSSGFSSVKVNDGNWHCVVGTAGNNQWKVYVDGQLESSAVGSTNNLATSLNERFTIGYHTDPNNLLWFDGDIDNVLIYNRVLADDEIECFCGGTLPDIEYCDCGSENDPIPNQIANGSFESGYSGFTSSLTPNIPCGWGSYVVANNANVKCSAWPSFNDHTTGSGNFMVIDGNPSFASTIWSEPVNVIPGMTYCFSYWTASIYPKFKQDFDLNVNILGNDGFNSTVNLVGTSNISEVFLPGQVAPSWIQHTLIWTCPNNLYGPYTIEINQVAGAFGDDFTDFGIDDICFTKFTKPDSCCVNNDYFNSLVAQGFTVTQNGCDVTVCSPQFDSCHYFGMEPTFGDGIPVPTVVVPANGCWSHTYTQSGTYNICATVFEDTCWSKVMCTVVNVLCDPSGCVCPAPSIVSNPSFEFGPSGFPNGQNQIGQCMDWFSSNGGVTSIGDWFSYPTPYYPGFYLDAFQGPLELGAHCGSKYAGIDLSTCEGISTALTTPIPPGNTYTVGFYWSISQPVTSPFNFHAIMSGSNCNVNLTSSNTCAHTCGGDFHIVVPVNFSHVPGVWYYHTISGVYNFPTGPAISNITFAGMMNQQSIDNYLFIDDVCVTSTPPDLCECRDADNLVLADGNKQIPTVPFNTVPISLSCDTTGNGIFTLFGEPYCAGDSCLGSDFSWIITDSSGFIVRLGSQPISGYTPGSNSGFFALQASKSAFTPGVIYTITITTYCGTKACPFSVQFVIDCDSCKCGTYTDLNWRPSQGAPNQEIHCGDFLTLGCLPPGFNVMFGGNFNCIGDSCPPSTINWVLREAITLLYIGSGTATFGPGFNFSLPESYFSNPGVYELFIVGECNGKLCPPCMFTITSQGCPCKCNIFDKINLVNKKSGTSQNLSCANTTPVVLNCPPVGKPFKITGKLLCDPVSCKGSNLHWELKKGSTVAASGYQSGPWFSITLDNGVLAGLNGVYDLVLTGSCGNETCTCVLQFDISGCPVVSVCPCDNQFYTNVALGFTYGWDGTQGGCSWKFTPKVTDCDSVVWDITGPNGFVTSGSKVGNQPFTATFPNGTFDAYKVSMKVHRPGTNCWQTYCTYVTLNCLITGGISGMCENNEIENSGFNENSIAGILGHGGSTQGWTSRSGAPVLMDGDGCGDPFSIQLVGRCAKEEVDIIDYPVFIPAGQPGFKFSACYWASQEELRPGTQLILRLSDFPQETTQCSELCFEVGRIPIDLPSGEEWKTIATSSLLEGVSGNKYLTLHIENDLIDEDLDANSNVWLDNLCFEQNGFTIVPTSEIIEENQLVRIYPNPNSGEFKVELSEAATDGMSLRVVGLTGQRLLEKPVGAGAFAQTIKANHLASGMYFIQVVSEGRILSVHKFVKE